jgi:hypothetical protein
LDWVFKIWIRFANVVDFKDMVVFFDYEVVERTQMEEEKEVMVVGWCGLEKKLTCAFPNYPFIFSFY